MALDAVTLPTHFVLLIPLYIFSANQLQYSNQWEQLPAIKTRRRPAVARVRARVSNQLGIRCDVDFLASPRRAPRMKSAAESRFLRAQLHRLVRQGDLTLSH